MNFLHSLYGVLYYRTQAPKLFGGFHIAGFLLTIAAIILAVRTLKSAKDITFRKFLFFIWIILIVLEIYREVAFSLHLQDGVFFWDYAWYQFPFQLCGTPLYVIPIVIFAKDGKLRRACMSFLAIWSLFGGLTVLFYPADIFVDFIGICIQSFFHHAAQVLIGVVIAVRVAKSGGLNKRFFLGGLCVFTSLCSIAMVMNYLAYHIFKAHSINDDFNMFFISPYYDCVLPILSEIQRITSYPVFLLTYFIGFTVIASIIFCIEKIFTDKFVKPEVLK